MAIQKQKINVGVSRTLRNKSVCCAHTTQHNLTAWVTAAEPRDKARNCNWLVATTNVEFARTLATKVFQRAYIGNKSLTHSIFEVGLEVELVWTTKDKRFSKSKGRRTLTTFGRKSANHPTYNKSRLMYARH